MTARYQDIGFEDFYDSPGFYKRTIFDNPDAFQRLFELLNNLENEHKLISVSEQGLPALEGVLKLVETEPYIVRFLETDTRKISRTTVGYVIGKKMEKLGWQTTGDKDPLSSSLYFTTEAEIYRLSLTVQDS